MADSLANLMREQRGEQPHDYSPVALDARYEKLKQTGVSIMDRETYNRAHPVKESSITDRVGRGLLAGFYAPWLLFMQSYLFLSTKLGAILTSAASIAGYILYRKKPELTGKIFTYGTPAAWGGWTAFCVGSNLLQNETPLVENARAISYDNYLSQLEEKFSPRATIPSTSTPQVTVQDVSESRFQDKVNKTSIANPSEAQGR